MKLIRRFRSRSYNGIITRPTEAGVTLAKIHVARDIEDIDRVMPDDGLEEVLTNLIERGWRLNNEGVHPRLVSPTQVVYVSSVRDPVRDWALGYPVRWRREVPQAAPSVERREPVNEPTKRVATPPSEAHRLALEVQDLVEHGPTGAIPDKANKLAEAVLDESARREVVDTFIASAEDEKVEWTALAELGHFLDTLPRGADRNEPVATTALRLLRSEHVNVESGARLLTWLSERGYTASRVTKADAETIVAEYIDHVTRNE